MKKNHFLLFALVFIISLLASCKKDPLDTLPADEARMHGKILEKGTKKPVRGARVYLRNCTCVLGGCNCSTIDSLTTDASGAYDFTYKFKGFSGRSFDIFVRVPEGFRQENSPVALAPSTHDNVNYDVEIKPTAWVKIHVKNINPFDEFDFVWVSGGWSGAIKDDMYYGKTVDLFLKKDVIGNDTIGISWDITKNNIDYFKTAKVYCPAHDTTKFEILY